MTQRPGVFRAKYPRCAVCGIFVSRQKSLSPVRCMKKVGHSAAHRICVKCWFLGKGTTPPFADEGVAHACPGCVKQEPYTPDEKKQNKETEILLLSS